MRFVTWVLGGQLGELEALLRLDEGAGITLLLVQMMRIAIIGTGISGLVAAYLLNDIHELTLFESSDYVGGHTHTVGIDDPAGPINVDTGFIVYNERTYPNFCKLLNRLGVDTQPSSMSFSFRDEARDIEYSASNLSTIFAQRRNLIRPSHYRMLLEILRFYRQSRSLLNGGSNEMTLGTYLRDNGYSDSFVDRHLIPVGAAIWSADPQQLHEFPASYFVRFCHNHGMLDLFHRPQWRVISGGSHRYVEKLTRSFRSRIRLNSPVAFIRRAPTHVEVSTAREPAERFDQVIIATHSDQALRMLSDPTPAERDVLGPMRYQKNDVALHTDTACLPVRKRAWASWNYRLPKQRQSAVTMTYNMNMLQSLDTKPTYCVTLNATDRIDDRTMHGRFAYDHPVFTLQSVASQRRHAEISGVNRTHYCGAYWGYGFHEDGVNSALAVCQRFGREL